MEAEGVELQSGTRNRSDEGAWDPEGPEPRQGCTGAHTCRGRQPHQGLAENACRAAALWRGQSCLHSFSFQGLFNISNKNKINNGSVYGNLRQK